MTEACANCGSPTTEYTYDGEQYCSKMCINQDAEHDVLELTEEDQQLAWLAWREAWRRQSSMGELSGLDERTARSEFERWWAKR